MGYSDIKELLTDAKNIATGANDLQLKSILLDIQGTVFELQEENKELRSQITEFKQSNIVKSDLVWKGNVYFYQKNGPYCTNCMDDGDKLIRMRIVRMRYTNYIGAECPKCGNSVKTDILAESESQQPEPALNNYLKDL